MLALTAIGITVDHRLCIRASLYCYLEPGAVML